MTAAFRHPNDRTSVEVTLDSTPRAGQAAVIVGQTSTHTSGSLACPVEMVRGAAPELTRETNSLLRSRLRLAAIVLSVGFAAFLARQLMLVDFSEPGETFIFWFHAATTVVLALFGIGLCHRHTFGSAPLRLAELVVFGLPAVYFALEQRHLMLLAAERGSFEMFEGPWLVLMFTYALFIPNTMPRAVAVLSTLAALPITLLLWMIATQPTVAAVATYDALTGIVLMLLVAAGASVFGVDTIGTLRRQAFEARQLGQYRLTRRIGAGGMGEVYLAEHRLLKRPCVVKLIRPDRAGNAQALARFQREVRSTAKLSHWNTIEIFDYGSTEDGTFYYVMEYLPGMSLAEMVDQFGPLPPARVVHLLRQACDALSEAHEVGLIHRDLKPGNIFAAKRGGVYDIAKLLDFGLVKPLLDDERALHLTADGSITGSPLYMSPEQGLGSPIDPRSDLYSLGAVAYFLLTGQPPFAGDKPIKVIFAHVNQPVIPPVQLRNELPDDLNQIVLRCLAKDPADRFTDAASLERALAQCDCANRWTRDDAAHWWQGQDVRVEELEVPAQA